MAVNRARSNATTDTDNDDETSADQLQQLAQLASAAKEGDLTEQQIRAIESLKVNQMFSMPLGMKSLVEAQAKEAHQNVASYIRTKLAGAVGYTLPAEAVKGAYDNVEERKAAYKRKNQQKRDLMKAIAQQYRAGAIDMDDDDDDDEDDA